ncbi:MAG TPA: 50S ribosomal protein L10 [Defluviitoga sp.]|nr:50S ribosomal protein L10 [Defluviitoga sp.]HOP24623.1 50S ribosomal protein L10 [Defluviitoga sp.]HPZ28874.1 50S ribosomal protein L10 [Defluviitoga sp.]HQD62639.1 50S ribosomal protein L10 [Defluviitoga sp.]
MLTKELKKGLIQDFIDALENANLILFIDFTGMNVPLSHQFRMELYNNFEENVVYKVYRNSLLKTAIKLADKSEEDFEDFLKGPTGILYAKNVDPIEVLKFVKKFSDSNKGIPFIKGGILERQIIDSEKASEYAKLPSKQELYAMVVRSINYPIFGLVNALAGNIRNLVYVLNAIKENK